MSAFLVLLPVRSPSGFTTLSCHPRQDGAEVRFVLCQGCLRITYPIVSWRLSYCFYGLVKQHAGCCYCCRLIISCSFTYHLLTLLLFPLLHIFVHIPLSSALFSALSRPPNTDGFWITGNGERICVVT